jgi:zinc protease
MKTPKTILVSLTVSLTLALAGLQAQALPRGVQQLASVEGITEYRLDNGLRVLLFPDASKPTVTINITYLVGSKHENYGETGMAHLLEHMVFKGTKNRGNIFEELGARGASFNGTTWVDRTNYYETLPSTDENLRWTLEMESDRMVNSRIAKEELDKEMSVVRNEFEMGENSPFRVLFQRVMSAAYDWHNYGKSTIGARSDIENVPIERLHAFYQRYYQPDNAILVVAGKFDQQKALGWIAQYLGALPRPGRKLDQLYTAEPTQDGERTVSVKRVGDVQMIMTAFHIPAGTHSDYAAVEVLANVLADSPSGRLYKALVDNKKAASVLGMEFQLAEPGLILMGAQVRKEQSMDEARKVLLDTIAGAVKEPPTAEEVDRAKTKLLKQIDLDLANSERIGIGLSEWASMADWRMMFIQRDRLKEVKPDDVQRVAKLYLKDDNRTVGVFLPTEKPDRTTIPPTPDVTKLVAEYKGGAVIEAGEVFDPSPANVESRAKRVQLANGTKLVMLPKKTRGATVLGRITLRYGDEKTLFAKSTACQMAWSMLMRGTSRHTRQQIQEELDKLKARVNFGGNVQFGAANLETVRANLPAVLKLVAEIYRDPAFAETEFDQVKQAMLAGLENRRREPQFVAFNQLRRHLNPYPRGDVRAIDTPDEEADEVRKTTLADARNFYKEFFGGSSSAVMTLVGDFDAAEVQKLATELFGDWKTPKPVDRPKRDFQKVGVINRVVETPDKANAMFAAGMNIQMDDAHPDYAALTMANYLFGGSISSRLLLRMRQKEGWSYGAGSMFNAPVKDSGGGFTAYAILAPQNMARLEAGFQEEVKKAIQEGFNKEEFEKGKAAWLQEQQVDRADDRGLLGTLSGNEYWGRTMSWQADIEKKMAALTLDQVSAAMKKYIDTSAISIVKAGDFKKVGQPDLSPTPRN